MHLMADEGRVASSGCRPPDSGDMWRYGCPKESNLESEDEAWSEDESVSSSVSRENNVCNGAVHVIGCMGLVDTCEGGIKLSHCPG